MMCLIRPQTLEIWGENKVFSQKLKIFVPTNEICGSG